MTYHFNNRLEAIDWIAAYADDEGQFEVLREQITMNFIKTGQFFLDLQEKMGEVVMLEIR